MPSSHEDITPTPIDEGQVRVYDIPAHVYQEVSRRFHTRLLTSEQLRRVNMLRDNYESLAKMVMSSTPPGRSQAMALTDLETSLHAAVKAIAHEEA